MDIDMAMAANRVILTTERIVSNEQIRRTPGSDAHSLLHGRGRGRGAHGLRARTSATAVRALLLALDAYAARTSKDPVKGCQQYLEEFYYWP
jgi:glutaconate CoA-transferase subunit A